MPITEVVFFLQSDGSAPVRQWLADLRRRDVTAHDKCLARISRLAEMGFELRRPEADFLRDGIHELRVRRGNVNYRILYCFHGRGTAVLLHGVVKEGAIPETDFRRALDRRAQLETDPQRHVQEN